MQHLAWSYSGGEPFLDAVEQSSNLTRVLVLLGTGALVALVMPLIGWIKSGPSELEATIWFDDGRLPVLKTILKAVFSIVIVALGASLGRETAPKQAGALVGGLLAEWGGLTATKRRLLAACGAGAGIAAVYDVPFGGALFALEVLLGTLSLPLVAPAFVATLTATMAYWLFFPNEPTYHIGAMPLTAGLVVFALLAAPLAGLASAAFVTLLATVAEWKPTGWRLWPAALGVFGLLGALAIPFPQLLGNGKDAVEVAALGQLALPTLVALAILKPLATAACLGTGAPGGLFTPTITFGALLGGALGHVWGLAWPGAPAGACAMIGATAVLAATTKGPVSAVVMMLELTHGLDGLLVPMLLVAALSTAVAHRLDPRSTYTCRLGRAATLDDGPVDVSSATPYPELLKLSLAAGHPLAVRDQGGAMIGTLGRDDLLSSAAALRPVEIATARDVIEARDGARLEAAELADHHPLGVCDRLHRKPGIVDQHHVLQPRFFLGLGEAEGLGQRFHGAHVDHAEAAALVAGIGIVQRDHPRRGRRSPCPRWNDRRTPARQAAWP